MAFVMAPPAAPARQPTTAPPGPDNAPPIAPPTQPPIMSAALSLTLSLISCPRLGLSCSPPGFSADGLDGASVLAGRSGLSRGSAIANAFAALSTAATNTVIQT